MHHDTDLQRHADATGKESKAMAYLRRWRWFGLVVIMPTLLATLYYGLIASSIYVSESRFVIKAPDTKTGSGGALGAVLQGTGFGSGREQASEIIG